MGPTTAAAGATGAVARLVAVPNFSEGRSTETIDAIARALGPGLLDVHSDPDHNRSVFTLAGRLGELSEALVHGAASAIERIDLGEHEGAHPRIGALDVAPIVYTDVELRGAACAEALVLADRLAHELELPVFLYGALSSAGHTRAELRRGGPAALAERLAGGALTPDFGPRHLHPSAGAVLVAARPPLVAFNVELAPPASLEDARRVAALIREGGADGLPGVRAIGVWLAHRQRAQVSTNVEDHQTTPLAKVLEAIGPHATVERAELVGLAPRTAFDGLPEGIALSGRRHLEDALAGPDPAH